MTREKKDNRVPSSRLLWTRSIINILPVISVYMSDLIVAACLRTMATVIQLYRFFHIGTKTKDDFCDRRSRVYSFRHCIKKRECLIG